MSNRDKLIVVTGATGQQGGATARHLLTQGFRVRVLVRDPNKPAAQELAGRGVQTFMGPGGPVGEARQGKVLVDAAKAAGIQHLVYTSVGGADRKSGLPHFESRWQIEEHIRSLGLPATILRPVFYKEMK